MSTVTTEFPPPAGGWQPKYPWNMWTDGQIHVLKQGEHFHVRPKMFAKAAHMHAMRHDFDVKTAIRGELVWLQFTRRARGQA